MNIRHFMRRLSAFGLLAFVGVTASAQVLAGEENPYGLQALWAGGDIIARATLIAMIVMSAGSWFIIITKLWEQVLILRSLSVVEDKFWRSTSVAQGITQLKAGSAIRHLIEEGVNALGAKDIGLGSSIERSKWLELRLQAAVAAISEDQQRGLSFLATVGSTAPFVGLFGTVWGIYHALTAIGVSGQASIDKVAGPVGEALIMTAAGLAVAVPALLGYNWLMRRNKSIMERVRAQAVELEALLLSKRN